MPVLCVCLVVGLNFEIATAASKTSKDKIEMANDIWLPSFDELIDQRWSKLFAPSFSNYFPRINIQEYDNRYRIEAELPGIKKEEVEIKLKDGYLVISGEKKSASEEVKNSYRRIERSSGTFYRAISVPMDIDKEKITAELSDGILKIDIAKVKNAPASTERKILIK